MRFPDPRYVFTNLARLWNAFYSQEVLLDEEAFYEWLTAHISISGYRLATRTAFIAKGAPVIGFKGWVNYTLSGEKTGYIKWIDALAKFAEYSNVGGGRTAGFGCVNYNPKKLANKSSQVA